MTRTLANEIDDWCAQARRTPFATFEAVSIASGTRVGGLHELASAQESHCVDLALGPRRKAVPAWVGYVVQRAKHFKVNPLHGTGLDAAIVEPASCVRRAYLIEVLWRVPEEQREAAVCAALAVLDSFGPASYPLRELDEWMMAAWDGLGSTADKIPAGYNPDGSVRLP